MHLAGNSYCIIQGMKTILIVPVPDSRNIIYNESSSLGLALSLLKLHVDWIQQNETKQIVPYSDRQSPLLVMLGTGSSIWNKLTPFMVRISALIKENCSIPQWKNLYKNRSWSRSITGDKHQIFQTLIATMIPRCLVNCRTLFIQSVPSILCCLWGSLHGLWKEIMYSHLNLLQTSFNTLEKCMDWWWTA